MRKAKVKKIVLDRYGSFLGMEKGCFIVKEKNGKEQKYPLFEKEIGEVVLKSGSTVSVGSLASLGFWEIDTLILTRRGKPVAMLRSLEYDSHVKTRLCQYEAYESEKAFYIAKQLALARVKSQNMILNKYGLKINETSLEKIKRIQTDDIRSFRNRLMAIEGKHARQYMGQILSLFPEWIRPLHRRTYQAYDGLNNIFNLAYELLKWKVHIALVKARLEPYLGFLHSLQWGKPSLVCDFQEIYRHLIEDFLIGYCQSIQKKDFIMKWESFSSKRQGKREYLNNAQTKNLTKCLCDCFQKKVEVPRIKRGKKQEIETLINEEALLFAKFLRNERETWIPRIAIPK